MSIFKRSKGDPKIGLTELKKTEDYALVIIEEADGYFVINTKTGKIEVEEPRLPSALYEIDAIQAALDKYREAKGGPKCQ